MSESISMPSRSNIKDIIIAVLITAILSFTKGISYGRDISKMPFIGTPAAAVTPAPVVAPPK